MGRHRKQPQHRRRNAVTGAAAAGLATFGAAVAFSATAAAEPPPAPLPLPGDPAPPPPPPPDQGPIVPMLGMPLGPAGFGLLAQQGQEGVPGALGAPAVNGLDRASVLGQNLTPQTPTADPGIVPNLNVFNNAYGLPQYEVPSAPGQGVQFDVAPGAENDDVTRREWFGRFIDMQRDHRLYGGLGQMPQEQLGQPLPGTAPPPGTVISPGLVQYLPDPADGPVPPPGLILPPPPDAPPG
jgi:hypothetical protein